MLRGVRGLWCGLYDGEFEGALRLVLSGLVSLLYGMVSRMSLGEPVRRRRVNRFQAAVL